MTRLIQHVLLLLRIFRSFAFFVIILDVICVSLLSNLGISAFNGIFWFKLVASFAGYWIIFQNKKEIFYYYYNLGLTKLNILVSIASFDFVTFILITYFIAS